MNKKITALGATLGLVILLGAGCANPSILPGASDNNPNTTVPSADQTTPPVVTTDQTPTDQTTPTETTTDFTVTVTPTGKNSVSVEWTPSANLDRASSFRVLNSARPNPESPKAYWAQYMNITRSAELKTVPSGHRYFRVCEYKNDTCVNYSNEVEVDVE
jgi:hypothetical protein